MAITAAQYSSMFSVTESDANGLSSDEITQLQDSFTNNEHIIDDGMFRVLKPVLFQIQKMQSELDYLRGLISTNKDKAGISSSQASAITANTAKTSMVIGSKATQAMAGSTALLALGTSGTTALAGDTNIVTIGSSTTIAFGDMVTVPGKGKTPASYSIVMTVTNGGVSKTTTLTLT